MKVDLTNFLLNYSTTYRYYCLWLFWNENKIYRVTAAKWKSVFDRFPEQFQHPQVLFVRKQSCGVFSWLERAQHSIFTWHPICSVNILGPLPAAPSRKTIMLPERFVWMDKNMNFFFPWRAKTVLKAYS